MWYNRITTKLFPTRRGKTMTDRQEIKVKSMEMALAFMGLVFELPMVDAEKEDEVAEFDKAFKYAEYFSRKFESFILTETPDLPKQ
jgi:hypothetical protein